MNSENQSMGILFNSIEYKDNEQLKTIIDNIGHEQAYFFIVKAIEYSYSSGIFNLTESEIVSKSLRTFGQRKIEDEKTGNGNTNY
jgi:hypothetical protein